MALLGHGQTNREAIEAGESESGSEKEKDKEMEKRQDQRQTRERDGRFSFMHTLYFDFMDFYKDTHMHTRVFRFKQREKWRIHVLRVVYSKLQALCDAAATQFTQKDREG